MTIIRTNPGPNPLKGWQVDPAQVRYIGEGLQRPECILATRDGMLYTADARGGVVRIAPDGGQTLIAQQKDDHFDLAADPAASLLSGTLPNGLAFDAQGNFLIANFGTDRLETMARDGATRVLLADLDGMPMGKVNFVLRDRRNRYWITISTRVNPWSDAIRSTLSDGYIVLIDEKGARVVADGFSFTNEVRLDAKEEWLYVAETTGKRITRLRVRPDGSLTDREVFGPDNLGRGLIDGITFDAYGNLWGTMFLADRLIALTPDGELLELMDDGDAAATDAFEAAFATGESVSFDVLGRCGGTIAPWLASVTFGGSDLTTAYLGSLKGSRLPFFTAPVAGLPMVHWE